MEKQNRNRTYWRFIKCDNYSIYDNYKIDEQHTKKNHMFFKSILFQNVALSWFIQSKIKLKCGFDKEFKN